MKTTVGIRHRRRGRIGVVVACVSALVSMLPGARALELPPRIRGAELNLADLDTEVVERAARWNVNCLHLKIRTDGADAPAPTAADPLAPYRRQLERLPDALRACRKYEIPVILTAAAIHGQRSGQFWQRTPEGREARGHLVAFWQRLARELRQAPAIAGYGILNGPDCPMQKRDLFYEELVPAAMAAIRRHAPDKWLLVQPVPWGMANGFRAMPAFEDRRILYSFDHYEPTEYTRRKRTLGPDGELTGAHYPGMIRTRRSGQPERWNQVRLAETMAAAKRFSDEHPQARILVGAFGVKRWAPGALHWLRDSVDLFERRGWGWCLHSIAGWHAYSLTRAPAGAAGREYDGGRSTPRLQLMLEAWAKNGLRPKPPEPNPVLENAGLFLSTGRDMKAQVSLSEAFLTFTCRPQTTSGGSTIFRLPLNGKRSLIIDLGQAREINCVKLRKHFWPFRAIRDADLDRYTGEKAPPAEVGRSDAWETIARVRDDLNHNEKTFSFPSLRARFLRLRPLEAVKDDNLADICEISVGRREALEIEEFTARADEGGIELNWRDVLPAEEPPVLPPGDDVSWNHSPRRGFYRVWRSANPDDGFRCINMAGEVTQPHYRDENIVPGTSYRYKVSVHRHGFRFGETGPVTVTAPAASQPAGRSEAGLWQVSAGRFCLDDGVFYNDVIETHGNIGGYTYGIINRRLFLLYPSLSARKTWNPRGVLEGAKQARNLAGVLGIGSIGLTGTQDATPRYRVLYSGWDSMSYESVYPDGRTLTTTMNGLVPALTLQTGAGALSLFADRERFGTRLPARVAFVRNGKPVVARADRPVNLEAMDAPWLLFWWGDGELSGDAGVDVPCLVVLSRRPEKLAPEGGGLTLTFPEGADHFSFMPLYGVEKVSTAGWRDGLPASATERAGYWTKRLQVIPTHCRDRFRVDAGKDRIRVAMQYGYLDASGAWDTQAVRLAPVPPSTAFAKRKGYPVDYVSDVRDQDLPCFNGPYEAAENAASVEYTLPADMDAVRTGYQPRIVRPDLLPDVREALNLEAQLEYNAAQDVRDNPWRPRLIDLRIQQFLQAHLLASDTGREHVARICEKFIYRNRYFDLSTYEFRRDRYSGRKYSISIDPQCRFSLTVDYGFGAGGALWTIYKYADVLNRWDEIRDHWESILQYGTVFEAGNSWNQQSCDAMTFYSEWGGNPDYIMSYLQAHLALARMAHRVGDRKTYRRNLYLFSRTLMTYIQFMNIQSWTRRHQPHYSPRDPEGDRPMQGYTYAPSIRGDGLVFNFINSTTPNGPYTYYPFVRACPDIAIFWDKYMRETMARYIYRTVREIAPNGIEAHVAQARAFLFDNDPDHVRKWMDHLFLRNGDWGNSNHFATMLTMLCNPPVPLQAPDPAWVDRDYEARIRGENRNYTRLDYADVRRAPGQMHAFNPLWTIGRSDNSGEEFSPLVLTRSTLKRIAEERNPDLNPQQIRKLLKTDRDYFRNLVEQLDRQVFRIGENTASEWRYIHLSAWQVMGGGMSYEGRHHPRIVEFDLEDPDPERTYHLVVDLHRRETYYPLFYWIEIDSYRPAVRCPLPYYSGYRLAGNTDLPPEAGQAILAFPIPGEKLRDGRNRVVLHVEGSTRVYYDQVAFGRFETGAGSRANASDGPSSTPADALRAGAPAPDFTLPSVSGKTVSLSDYRGDKAVVLYFYPRDDTPGCTREACDFRDARPLFHEHDAVILGVSPDSVASHKNFAGKYNLPFELLSDPRKRVFERYGALRTRVVDGRKHRRVARTTILIDRHGRIARYWPNVSVRGHAEEVLDAVRNLH